MKTEHGQRAFADRDATKYLIRDRDSIYGKDVHLRIASMGIEEVLTAPQSLAEPLRRTPDRLAPKRVLEPFHHPEREASEASPGLVFRLLPRVPNPFGPRQAMSDSSTGFEHRQDHHDPAAGRSPSPL